MLGNSAGSRGYEALQGVAQASARWLKLRASAARLGRETGSLGCRRPRPDTRSAVDMTVVPGFTTNTVRSVPGVRRLKRCPPELGWGPWVLLPSVYPPPPQSGSGGSWARRPVSRRDRAWLSCRKDPSSPADRVAEVEDDVRPEAVGVIARTRMDDVEGTLILAWSTTMWRATPAGAIEPFRVGEKVRSCGHRVVRCMKRSEVGYYYTQVGPRWGGQRIMTTGNAETQTQTQTQIAKVVTCFS
ncbi:hypothetical protein EDB85DRAFT_1890824 [Lactarius pseudohatsudake]|nr:hypothetical protein EDB85DRAFT_1890824 [Lactarius pseudohatsudake]